ncbi:hypothetical protein R1flu_016937 [Riccia fluitans]|uniref:Uncharacterized protein n=1 Tax=Riccia fluitans TaxID=41844 RepID=A0ABD1YNA0_9MARC
MPRTRAERVHAYAEGLSPYTCPSTEGGGRILSWGGIESGQGSHVEGGVNPHGLWMVGPHGGDVTSLFR